MPPQRPEPFSGGNRTLRMGMGKREDLWYTIPDFEKRRRGRREAGTLETVSGVGSWKLTVRREGDGITVLRAVTCEPSAALPETLWGLPVTALGDHALAPGAGPVSGQEVGVACGPLPPDARWDNRNLRELTLPASLERAGDYALFNCAELKTLRLGDGVKHWGGGAIMNCRRLDTLQVDCTGREGELLAWFAGEVPGELDVTLLRRKETWARLIFPEYVEVYEENCPAHHFDYQIRGAGYGYHHCFHGKRLDLKAYDTLWRPMLAMEHDSGCALRLAWWRLRHPAELTDRAAADYRAYLRAHALEAVRFLLSLGDASGLGLLLAETSPDRETLASACGLARQGGNTAVLAILLEEQHRRFPAGAARDFTL